MQNQLKIIIFGLVFALPTIANAQDAPIIYPADGQSAEQQKTDVGECGVWATENTGIDPAALAQDYANKQEALADQSATSSAPPPTQRGGAVRGAAAGAVIGEIADDDAGKGAAYGAAAGAISQRRRNARGQQQAAQDQSNQQQQVAQQQQALSAEQKEKIGTYYRAFEACLTGRGYTVN